MNPLQAWLGRPTSLKDAKDLSSAVVAWRSMEGMDLTQPHFHTRYVAVGIVSQQEGDGELGGAIQSLAAVVVQGDGMETREVFYADIPEDRADSERVLQDFIQFVGNSVLVSFRADFGLASLRKVFARCGIRRVSPKWLDLTLLLPEIFPKGRGQGAPLSDWLDYLGLADQRGDALADALLNGKLFLQVLSKAAEHGYSTPKELIRVERARRWLWSH